MSSPSGTPHNPSPADSLPPVEPPSAGFIVQLFVIPAVIVTIIVIVWGLFTWLAHMGRDPQSYIDALKRNNESRWQEAFNLSYELRKSGNDKLKQNAALATELADMLNTEMSTGGYEKNAVTLRVYLCLALGQFKVPEVLPTLVKAAGLQRDEREGAVRLAALQALAQLMPNLDSQLLRSNADLYQVLLTASQETDAVVRHHAAYDLGMLGGDQARSRLQAMLADADLDVRLNAACGLARNGDAASVETLVAMIDPTDPLAEASQKEAWKTSGKGAMVRANALEAAAQLARSNSTADLGALAAVVDRLIESGPQADVRAEAEKVKQALAQRAVSPPQSGS